MLCQRRRIQEHAELDLLRATGTGGWAGQLPAIRRKENIAEISVKEAEWKPIPRMDARTNERIRETFTDPVSPDGQMPQRCTAENDWEPAASRNALLGVGNIPGTMPGL